MNIPEYFIRWIKSFLSNRFFLVNINGSESKKFSINAGVPQGSVISPLLFNIYINDLPKRDKTNLCYSLLFADDLVTYFIFKKEGRIEYDINNYLK